MDIKLKQNHVNINMKATGGIGTKDHSKLTNLDFENSGHTGFASAAQIQELLEKLNEKQNTLTAGDNISIIDDIISVTGLDKSEIYIGPDEPTDPNIKIWIDTKEVAQEFYTKQEIDEKGFATQTWVTAQGYLTQHQDLSEYAKKSEIPTKVSAFENDAGYLTQHQDLSEYALKTEIPTVPTKVSAFENDTGYLTQHQDLSEYAKKTELPSEYVKSATVQGNKLTLTNKDNTTVDFEPSGGGSGGGGTNYTFTDGLTETDGTVKWDLNDRIKSAGSTQDYNNSLVLGVTGGSKSAYQSGVAGGGYNGVIAGNYSLAFGQTREINSTGLSNKYSGVIAGNVFGSSAGTYQGAAVAFGFAEQSGLVKSSGIGSFAVGYSSSIIEGYGIQSTGYGSVAMGNCSSGGVIKASGNGSVAMGNSNGILYSIEATKSGAFAVGEASSDSQSLKATGTASFAQGRGTQATGFGSVAHGYKSTASGNYATANGLVTKASSSNQFVTGKRNIEDSSEQYSFIVGNGTSDSARSNAYTLDWQGNGTFAGTVSSSTGADYAEYFEWKDGNPNNEDRVGYIVTLDGDKIVKANTGDDVLGICSGTAMVLGDSAEWNWSKRFLTDDFGRIIYEDYDIEHEEIKDENTGKVIEEAWTEHIHAPKENPAYDPSKTYIKRADRPEWQIVGMMGKIYVRDDGSCIVNGYADVKDGIATKANGKTNMRVMERVTDNIVRVLMK